MRILYVEDHSANLFLVQRVARMGNHEVINYTEGETALANFEKDNPDMVLMDVQLPGKLTGLDVVKVLRSRGHTTPIIAVTAYAMMGDKERCIEAGCDGYIAKPLPVTELVETIKRFEKSAAAKHVEPAPAVAAPKPEAVASPVVAVTPPAVPVAPPAVTVTPAVPTEDETAPTPPSYAPKTEAAAGMPAVSSAAPVGTVSKSES